jgi:hypothetical protein
LHVYVCVCCAVSVFAHQVAGQCVSCTEQQYSLAHCVCCSTAHAPASPAYDAPPLRQLQHASTSAAQFNWASVTPLPSGLLQTPPPVPAYTSVLQLPQLAAVQPQSVTLAACHTELPRALPLHSTDDTTSSMVHQPTVAVVRMCAHIRRYQCVLHIAVRASI